MTVIDLLISDLNRWVKKKLLYMWKNYFEIETLYPVNCDSGCINITF